ncbi:hypothetical protein SAMN04489724_0204 [Algoriphagus locisalis]|uniref:Uncharacterized protein n=1 Tax=Algoriphagus locisalis TaxID=305507 RepID=A0A1I7E7A1_9BACT|nr:hypothetical protein SAMN04489724_0204 [Algoriphagus locisalis]
MFLGLFVFKEMVLIFAILFRVDPGEQRNRKQLDKDIRS